VDLFAKLKLFYQKAIKKRIFLFTFAAPIGSLAKVIKREPGENPGQSRCCKPPFTGANT